MSKCTISPVLEYIRGKLVAYENTLRLQLSQEKITFVKFCEALCDSMNVVSDIDNGKMAKSISEKVVGYFNFDKNINVKGKKHEGKMLLMNDKVDEKKMLLVLDKKKSKNKVDKEVKELKDKKITKKLKK
jgi:hypothetical protein